ncbi:MAG: DUF3769 domain-containing protein [Coleofasciculaceae cyanobacterium SM2_3_26]|nr:DUF3769 domain-containing protein [Coleofasciculaceae cyanobacterium SM2_3_26]
MQQPLSDRLITEQPFRVTSAGGIGIGNDANGGVINRVRFEADALEVAPEGWQATNIRLTNDPFSPPELELRAATARGIPIGPGETEIRADNPRLVFDQETSVPLLRNSVIIGRDRDPAVVQVGFDEDDRGGLFWNALFR